MPARARPEVKTTKPSVAGCPNCPDTRSRPDAATNSNGVACPRLSALHDSRTRYQQIESLRKIKAYPRIGPLSAFFLDHPDPPRRNDRDPVKIAAPTFVPIPSPRPSRGVSIAVSIDSPRSPRYLATIPFFTPPPARSLSSCTSKPSRNRGK